MKTERLPMHIIAKTRSTISLSINSLRSLKVSETNQRFGPEQQQPVQPVQPQQPVQPAPAAVTTAPPPPAQPTTVADYTGLPPGGTYDQSTGQTVYIQPDGVQWQMMGDGSFNRL